MPRFGGSAPRPAASGLAGLVGGFLEGKEEAAARREADEDRARAQASDDEQRRRQRAADAEAAADRAIQRDQAGYTYERASGLSDAGAAERDRRAAIGIDVGSALLGEDPPTWRKTKPSAPEARERAQDTALLEQARAKESARQTQNRATHAALVATYGKETVGPYADGVDYGKAYDEYARARTTGAQQAETARHNRASEATAAEQAAEARRHNRASETTAATKAGAPGGAAGGQGPAPTAAMRAKFAHDDSQLKTLSGLLDTYEQKLRARGPQLFAAPGNADDNDLSSAHTAVMMSLKNANDLGVLNGRDAEFLERQLSAPMGAAAKYRGKDGIMAQIGAVRQSLHSKRSALASSYGMPTPDGDPAPPTAPVAGAARHGPPGAGPARVSRAERVAQLKAAGASRDEARATLAREGY